MCSVFWPHPKAVATPELAEAGRQRTLRIAREHRVDKLLVFSTKASANMPPLREAKSGPLPLLQGAKFRRGTYDLGDKPTVVVGLRDPQYAPNGLMTRTVAETFALPIRP